MLNSQGLRSKLKTHLPEASSAGDAMPKGFFTIDELGIDSMATPLAARPPTRLASGIAIEDCDTLFNAVKTRLHLTVGEWLVTTTPELQRHGTSSRVQTSILECTAALDQLHMTLMNELGRRQHLELEVFSTKAALAQARTELAGTQAAKTQYRQPGLHDSQTSPPSLSFFRERLDQTLTLAAPHCPALAVLYLDLDGFKPLNEAHGHDAGDELLWIVATRLTRAVRTEDMLSHLGGDAFACLVADVSSREQLIHLASALFDVVSAPVKIGQIKVNLRPSIGIAMCPGDGATAEALIKNADVAMYRAKRQQTGYAFFDECSAA